MSATASSSQRSTWWGGVRESEKLGYRNSFELMRKMHVEALLRMSEGRVFQMVGTATVKQQELKLVDTWDRSCGVSFLDSFS